MGLTVEGERRSPLTPLTGVGLVVETLHVTSRRAYPPSPAPRPTAERRGYCSPHPLPPSPTTREKGVLFPPSPTLLAPPRGEGGIVPPIP